ncbi:MAG: chloramphenicol phosphotransferase CPT family protein [Candidatus Nanopelagicales bacterium]
MSAAPARRQWPAVILINGPSSAGKSTLARDLQTAVAHPYLVTGFDDCIFMSAPRYYLGADTGSQSTADEFTSQGVQMRRTSGVDEPPSVVADFGPVFRRILDAMAPAVRTLVDCGNDVIFDQVLHDQAHYDSLRKAFAGLDVFTVGVVCPLEVLEDRERSRGDRVLGRARGLADVVHSFVDYDAIVDTGAHDPTECVEIVLDALSRREQTVRS